MRIRERFNPRAPCGARRGYRLQKCQTKIDFNPRAPCGARRSKFQPQGGKTVFQPTRPLRGATVLQYLPHELVGFQPTRPLRGATRQAHERAAQGGYFNPRAPCGARPVPDVCYRIAARFQPTRPLRGATHFVTDYAALIGISTHAPLAGRDETMLKHGHSKKISTHAPLAGRDPYATTARIRLEISTHAPLAGRDDVFGTWSY